MKTIREKALEWWDELSKVNQLSIIDSKTAFKNRELKSLTGSGIEKIWWSEMEADAEQFAKENPAEKITVEKLTEENEQLNYERHNNSTNRLY